VKKTLLQYLGVGEKPVMGEAAERPSLAGREDDPGLLVTGEGLISSIYENIRMRRSTLVTGPRGCGKSYCSEQAIIRARDHGLIGTWRFLQGNREIPRDTLSEDMLVVGLGGTVELLKALALRASGHGADVNLEEFPDWPGIPTQKKTETYDPRTLWTPRDWVVLFLDEINRFGDGFLDSLLSLIEEGKIVRRGQDYYVPIVVVATANPPGYDVTAKKLSPPLQARITQSFRVSQPDSRDLVEHILPSKLSAFESAYSPGAAPKVSRRIRYLAAGATLCLWGDPDAPSKGNYYLTRTTLERLRHMKRSNPELATAMGALSEMIDFGPDARAVCDWLGVAMAQAARQGDSEVGSAHLESSCINVLGHKLRERFNEGVDPGKGIEKERLLLRIVKLILAHGDPRVFGYEEERPLPRPRSPGPVTINSEQFMHVIASYPSSRAFGELLAATHRNYVLGLLQTQDLTLVWLNTIEAVLHAHATPEKVREAVQYGFWTLYRAHAPSPQLNPAMLDDVAEMYTSTFEAIRRSSNPAGQERTATAARHVQLIKQAAVASPASPQTQKPPGTSGPTSW
jgi:MoxR-like ATPase